MLSANEELFGMPGYTITGKHRNNRQGGGVAIYVRQDIPFIVRNDLVVFNEVIETVFVEVKKDFTACDYDVIFVVAYRPPDTDVVLFSDQLNCIQEKMKREKKLCYFLGDFNIDLLKNDFHIPTTNFLDMLYANSYINLISRPTRVTSDTATLIDNIFTNDLCTKNKRTSGILTTDITDHYIIFHIIDLVNIPVKDDFFLTRKFSEKNKELFSNAISNIDWKNVLPDTGAQQAFSIFHSSIKREYDKYFPVVKVKREYSNRKPWLSDDLRESIKHKNKLYVKWYTRPTPTNKVIYISYKNTLSKQLKAAEKVHFQELLDKNRNNLKKNMENFENNN